MAKKVKINGKTWTVTPTTSEYIQEWGETHHVTDWAYRYARYVGKCEETGKEYWLSWRYKKDIAELNK